MEYVEELNLVTMPVERTNSLFPYIQQFLVEHNSCVFPKVLGFNAQIFFVTIPDIKPISVTQNITSLDVYYICSNQNIFQVELFYIWTCIMSVHSHIHRHSLYDVYGVNKTLLVCLYHFFAFPIGSHSLYYSVWKMGNVT